MSSPKHHAPSFSTVLLLVALVASCISLPAFGQAVQGKIEGIVKDPSGAFVVGAEVHAVDTEKGTDTMVMSNDHGEYQFASLLPGMYTIRARKAGFELFEASGLSLEVNQTLQLDIVFLVGKRVESVVVSSGMQQLEVHDASLGQVVTTQQIEELPLEIRSPLDLIALTPGVVLGPDFGNDAGVNIGRNFNKNNFNVGGGRSGSQAILIDGAPDTTGDTSRALINPPLDTVQEFKVQAATYDSQFGRTSGGIINMMTKSGSNTIHGSAYDFERDSAFDATNYFSQGNTTNFHLRQAGGVVGFPIIRNKVFGFTDFESLRQGQPITNVDTVPTDAERAGDFTATTYAKSATATPTPVVIYDPATYNPATGVRTQIVGCDGVTKNIICPSRISQLSQNLIDLYPHSNQAGGVNNANNYSYTANQYTDSYKYDFRSDINLRGRTTLFGKFSRQTDHRYVPGALPPANTGSLTTDVYTQAIIGLSHVISSNMMASLTTSFVRGLAIQVGQGAPLDITTVGFSSHFASQASKQLPLLVMSNVTNLSIRTDVGQQHQPRNTYATLGLVTYLHGHNSIKFGGEWWLLNFNEYQNAASSGELQFDSSFTQKSPTTNSSATQGYDLADLLLGIPSGINQVSLSEGSYIRKVQAISTGGIYYAAFAQDDYRATDRLTLNIGLRWDVSIGDREKYDRLAWFDPNAPSPLGPTLGNASLKGVIDWVGHGNDRNQQKTSWTNLNPRFGFAYHATKNLVVRGGYGVFFLPRSVQGNGVGALETTVDTEVPVDGPTPTTSLADPFAAGVSLPSSDRSPVADVGSSLTIPMHNFNAAYVQLFSIGFQEQLPWGILTDAHYWANLGTHIPTTADPNALSNEYVATSAAENASLAAKVSNPLYGIVPLQAPTTTLKQTLLPFPQYSGTITQELDGVGKTNYNALTVMAHKRLSQSLSFTTQYTWGKSMDDLGTPLNYASRSFEYGESDLDVTNQFVSSFIMQLPYGHGRHFGAQSERWVNGFLGGWNVNGILNMQSGLPVTISRPSYIEPGFHAHLDHPTPSQWFSTSGISRTLTPLTGTIGYTYGNAGKDLNGVRSDHTRNLDLNIEKNFLARWGQHELKTQIRAESYNALNHPQFSAPIGTVTSASFGTVTSQHNQPRAFQFGAKVLF